jgi:D-glycero-D-manno-heptose 1,7-bisphosphate phosphatase
VSKSWSVSPKGGPLALLSCARPDADRGPRAAVFLDRDGVINALIPDPHSGRCESPLNVEEVSLLPGAAAAAARLVHAGFALVCTSNQPAAAKGTVSVAGLQAVHERVLELLAREGVYLDGSYLCPHHPEGIVEKLSGACDCRKPRPGMLETACDVLGLDPGRSWMVGDTDADIAAGVAAGCRTMLIRNSDSAHKRLQGLHADITADNLIDGVERLHFD